MSEGRKTRRRWFAYNLRTFFAALTVLCLWLGWNANVVQQRNRLREQARVELAERVDWQFAFFNDGESPPKPPRAPNAKNVRKYSVLRRDYDAHLCLKQMASRPTASRQVSWLRKWLGDESIDLILVFGDSNHDLARSRFPEAHVYLMPARENR